MTESDQVALVLSSGVLRASCHEIEALTLEAIAAEGLQLDLDASLNHASHSDRHGGAFGIEIIGAMLIPILVDAVRCFWKVLSVRSQLVSVWCTPG